MTARRDYDRVQLADYLGLGIAASGTDGLAVRAEAS
jgi:hypothetical protein